MTVSKDLAGRWLGADLGWVSLSMEWQASCCEEMRGVPQLPTLNSLLHHQTELRLHFTRHCSSICCKSPFKKLGRLVGFLKYQHSLRGQALQCQHQASMSRGHHFDTWNLSSYQGSSAGQLLGQTKCIPGRSAKIMETFRLGRGLKEKRHKHHIFLASVFLALQRLYPVLQ